MLFVDLLTPARSLARLEQIIVDPLSDLPQLVQDLCRELLGRIAPPTTRINALKKTIDTVSKAVETSRRLQTMPGMGPIRALAVETFAPRWSSSSVVQIL